jgi:magnesium and cobalt exporter, CNNM family
VVTTLPMYPAPPVTSSFTPATYRKPAGGPEGTYNFGMQEAGDTGPRAERRPAAPVEPARVPSRRRAPAQAAAPVHGLVGWSTPRPAPVGPDIGAQALRDHALRRLPDATLPPGPLRRTLARLLVRGVDAGMRWVTRLLGASPTAGREGITEAELRDLVAANTVLTGEERYLIHEVLAAGARYVRELMVPRTEVVFLDARLSVVEAVALVRGARHSRFPVIDGSQDDVIGFVHLRDLTLRPAGTGLGPVSELARDVKRLPASKRVLAALSEMRREGHHLAVVVDEYGGTAGIVTLEDLIEELVGEIHDEYDAVPEPQPGAGTPSEVDGLLNLPDFAERTGCTLPAGPYETLGGFLMAHLGRLPRVGDEVRVNGWRMVVSALDGRRVARVTLAPPPVAASRSGLEAAG